MGQGFTLELWTTSIVQYCLGTRLRERQYFALPAGFAHKVFRAGGFVPKDTYT